MPTEIFGSVEVWNRALWHWMEIIDAGLILGRNELAFASVFGVGDADAGFAPVAQNRGLPTDVSPTVRRWSEPVASDTFPDGFWGHTYVSVAELTAVDWSEEATDPFVYCYRRSEATGNWIRIGKYRPEPPHGAPPGATWREEEVECRVRALTRAEALGEDFQLVYDLMTRLAQHYGDEHVRLVVWFREGAKQASE